MHEVVHAPQVVTLVRLVSQPSVGPPLQSPKGAAHESDMAARPTQRPPITFWSVQRLKHEPQFSASFVRFTSQPLLPEIRSVPSQSAKSVLQTHEPPTHVELPPQTKPHEPQLFGSVWRSRQTA